MTILRLAILIGCIVPLSCRVSIQEEVVESSSDFEYDGEGFAKVTTKGKKAGWTSLFNGKDLTGWEPAGGTSEADYTVVNRELRFPKKGKDGYIRTTTDHRDFELRLDFKISKMCNSGLFLRGNRAGGNPAFSGCEIQILDDFNWEKETKSKLQPYQFTGGLYGSVAPAVKDALKPLGQWNRYEIRYVGRKIRVRLNGHLLYDVDTHEVKGKPPFAERAATGFIGLQRHAPSNVEDEFYASFRNVFTCAIASAPR